MYVPTFVQFLLVIVNFWLPKCSRSSISCLPDSFPAGFSLLALLTIAAITSNWYRSSSLEMATWIAVLSDVRSYTSAQDLHRVCHCLVCLFMFLLISRVNDARLNRLACEIWCCPLGTHPYDCVRSTFGVTAECGFISAGCVLFWAGRFGCFMAGSPSAVSVHILPGLCADGRDFHWPLWLSISDHARILPWIHVTFQMFYLSG